jgi:signal transduction histidine kinase
VLDPVSGENAVLVTEVDITNLKDAEAALKLKEADQLEFFHHIVHELRTPLNGIINILESCIPQVSSALQHSTHT